MSIRGQVVKLERPLRRPEMQLEAKVDLHNRFDIEVVHPDGMKDYAVAHNIILNSLWTRLSTAWNWFGAIAYGSGTGTLAASRTDLFTRISAKTAGTLTADYTHFSDGYVSFRQQIQIGAGEITGQTLREVGIAYDTTAGHLMTHAQLKDMNGNVVSITVGALDVINIYATVYVRFAGSGYLGGGLRFYAYTYAYTFLFMVAGVANSNATPANIMSAMYAFSGNPPMTLIPTANVFTSPSASVLKSGGATAYDSAAKKITAKFSLAASTRIGASDLNLSAGGWYSIEFYGLYSRAGIEAIFPNNAKPYCTLTDESIGTGDGSTLNFATKFGHILNDGSAVLKVNGTAVSASDYTIEYGRPIHNRIGEFLLPVSGTYNFPLNGLNLTTAAGDWEIFENSLYTSYGITSFTAILGLKVECSNDLSNWVTIKADTVATGTINVTATYQKYRYWRVSTPSASTAGNSFKDIVSADLTSYPVHFAAGKAPATGGGVTLTYRTTEICKDTNHVVDLELSITLAEYTG